MGHLDWLGKLAAEIVIPAGVASEIESGPVEDPARRWLQTAGALYIQSVGEIDDDIVVWDLGCGESEVLAWARRHPGALASELTYNRQSAPNDGTRSTLISKWRLRTRWTGGNWQEGGLRAGRNRSAEP